MRLDGSYAYAGWHSSLLHPWWRHQMETFSALLAICAGISPVPGEFPTQRPVTRSFDIYFDLRPNKRLSKQSWGWWFETPPWSLWRHCNASHTTTHWDSRQLRDGTTIYKVTYGVMACIYPQYTQTHTHTYIKPLWKMSRKLTGSQS